MKLDVSLYVIIDKAFLGDRNIIDITKQIIDGGTTIIQLRAKDTQTAEVVAMGRMIMQVTSGKIPLIINDDVEAAISIGADGVHVGQKDLEALKARGLIGQHKILGVSASMVEQAKKAQQEGADYIGAGPVFPTLTKTDADPPIGLDGLRDIKEAVPIPVVAIGGINKENAQEVIAIADGIAVISAILSAENSQNATTELANIIKKFKRAQRKETCEITK